jgi:hypothetical protein
MVGSDDDVGIAKLVNVLLAICTMILYSAQYFRNATLEMPAKVSPRR